MDTVFTAIERAALPK